MGRERCKAKAIGWMSSEKSWQQICVRSVYTDRGMELPLSSELHRDHFDPLAQSRLTNDPSALSLKLWMDE